jgi:hypothetical protein
VPILTVPDEMVPGPAGYPFALAGPDMCDVGPNPPKLWPAAWNCVRIVAVAGAVGSNVTPDAAGRLLHCLWKFARPTVGFGKRIEAYQAWQPVDLGVGPDSPLLVETDPGRYWLGHDVEVLFVGGTPGDVYLVEVGYDVPRAEVDPALAIDVYEPAFEFRLTSEFFSPDSSLVDFPATPDWHTHFGVVSGTSSIRTATMVVPLSGSLLGGPVYPSTTVPLNLGRFLVGTGIFYTEGAI